MNETAAQSLLIPRKVPLKRFLFGSLVGHGLLIFAALFYSSFFAGPPLDLNQKPIHASLVRLGKERDQKMLPRKEEPPPPPPKAEEPAPPKPEPVAPAPPKVAIPIPGVKPTEVKPPKTQGSKQSDNHKKELFAAFNKSKSTSREAPEGAADGDVNGDSATQEGERYFGLLSAQVKRYYDVSETISDQERLRLNALLHVTIGRAGQLIDVKFERRSGNPLFDNAVLAAVKRAAPFPPPPNSLQRQLQTQGQVLSFKP